MKYSGVSAVAGKVRIAIHTIGVEQYCMVCGCIYNIQFHENKLLLSYSLMNFCFMTFCFQCKTTSIDYNIMLSYLLCTDLTLSPYCR